MTTADILHQLEGLEVADLDRIIEAAQQQREARRENGKKELLEEFAAKAAAIGVSLDDLFGGGPAPRREPRMTATSRKQAKAAADAKYRDPETGSTWSGRGRIPGWLKQAEAAGRGRTEFAIRG